MKSGSKKFIQGALILAGANLLVKIIGAFFKVPLYRLIDGDGNGIFSVAYQIYTFMFIIATAGFPIAVSKMVAESIAKGDEYDARRIFQTAFMLLGIIGLAGSTALFVFADKLAVQLGNAESALGIKVISPAIFFVSLVSAYRGYFQGKQNMYPTAGSEVVEASGKMIVGIVVAATFMGMAVNTALGEDKVLVDGVFSTSHNRTVYAATGAIFGVTAGTFLALILMMLVYAFKERKNKPLRSGNTRTRMDILKQLIPIAIPITIGASVSSLTSLVDLATIMNRLVINEGVFEHYSYLFAAGTEFAADVLEEGWQGIEILRQKANTLYGIYTGQAQTMFNLPLTIVVGLSMSSVPAISTAIAERKPDEAQGITASVLRITMLFALPCAVGYFVLSAPILRILYPDAYAALMLQKLAVAVPFVALVSVSNSVLQSYGKVYWPVINMLIGGIVKVAMNYALIPVWGIDAAPVATTVCYGVIALLNIFCITGKLKVKLSLIDMVIKPFCAAAIMGIAVAFAFNIMEGFLGGSKIVTAAAIGVGMIVYLIAIVAVRGFKRDDVLNMPKGEKLANIMTRFKLL